MNRFNINKRIVMGMFILALGIILLLGTFDVLDSSEIFSKGWPLIIILVGLLSLFNNGTSKIFGLILILIGVFYQLKVMDILFQEVNLWQFAWPILIIMAGLYLIIPKRPHVISGDTLTNSATAIFSGCDVNVDSKTFSGGEVTAVFGGVDIDLRKADMDITNPPVIDLFVAFGGVDIKVPDDWTVQTKGLIIFGGVGNKKKTLDTGSVEILTNKVLIIKYFGMFGGMDIK